MSPVIELSDARLDELRQVTDPLLTPLLRRYSDEELTHCLKRLFSTSHLPEHEPLLAPLCDALAPHPIADLAQLEKGQRLFQLFGPEILLILGCCGLPAAYAAAEGVEVIYRSKRLSDHGKRRLCETAQMVINVMAPNALQAGAVGTQSARKVRLMHGLVREHTLRVKGPQAWPTHYAPPLNQEDMAGTLLTFSALVLHSLRRLGAVIDTETELAFLGVWRHVGRQLGVVDELMPTSMPEALRLAQTIARRQFQPSAAGAELTAELVQVIDSLFPVPGYGLSLMHFLLEDGIFEMNLATVLQLPARNWTRWLVALRAAQKRHELHWLSRVPGAEGRRRFMARRFAQRLIALQNPAKTTPFPVPSFS